MVHGAQEAIDNLKKQIEEQNQEDKQALQQQSEEIVEEAIQGAQEDAPGDDDNNNEEELDTTEDDESEEADPEAVEEEGGEEEDQVDAVPPKNNKGWAKMRHQLKEKDKRLAEMEDTIRQIQLQQAEQKGFQDALVQSPQEVVNDDPEPDSVLDPEEHTAWLIRQKDKEIADLKSTTTEHAEFIQQQNDRRAVQSLENDYKRQNPDVDFEDAKEFVKERERQMLRLQNPGVSDFQINTHLEQQEMALYKNAANQGQSAANIIVEMAKHHGYEPKNSEPESKKKPNLKKIKENQKKSASLIGGTDAVSERGVTPEQVFSMSMDDILKGGPDVFKKAHQTIQRNTR